jgi:CheY-like chemotaxis protein
MKRTVVAAVDDLFFAGKIRAAAEHESVELYFPRTLEAVISTARDKKADLIIADLQSEKLDAIALAKQVKSDEDLRGAALVGFYSHVLTHLEQEARAAGYTKLLPRSAFSRNLVDILRGSID